MFFWNVLGAATGSRGVVVPDGESTEGRGVRTTTLPYVLTGKERREHNVTHYPHRTWCETCMSGRAVACAHSRNKDESDPFAGEFHLDYCFLKNEVKDDPAVTLVRLTKLQMRYWLMWCRKREPGSSGWRLNWSGTSDGLGIMGDWWLTVTARTQLGS